VENEEDEYPVANIRIIIIRIFNELKEELKKDKQDNLMKLKRTQIKISKKTQNQLNELREDLNKLQNKTKVIIKRDINEIKKSTRYERGV
jgi:hypothetical protein